MADVIWDGNVPVDDEDIKEWYRNGYLTARINYVNRLSTVVSYEDIDACNEDMDDIVGVPLVDLSYGIDAEGTVKLMQEHDYDNDAFVMFVEGFIDWMRVDDLPEFINRYLCPYDQTEWEDTYTARCNDCCPTCNREIEPYESEDA